MSASLISEEETGTATGGRHPHNGYYAGDFSNPWIPRRTAAGFLTAPPAPLHSGPVRGWHNETDLSGSRATAAPDSAVDWYAYDLEWKHSHE